MPCVTLKKVPYVEDLDGRLRKAVEEMRKLYLHWVPYSGFYESLCVEHGKVELIFYIDMKKNIEECIKECVENRKKMHRRCVEEYGEEACWQYDEETEAVMCKDHCEGWYMDKADTAEYKIVKSLDVMQKYGIKYVERISHPSPYEVLIKVSLRL